MEWWPRPKISTGDISGGGGHPVTGCVDRIGDVRRSHETVIADHELLIQRLLGSLRPARPVIQKRSRLTNIEIMLQSMLPVGSVKEVDVPRPESLEGCFSCGELTRETEQSLVLDESFPFLPLEWRADRIDDEFILRPGPTGPPCQQAGNVNWSGERGWSPGSVMTMNPSSLLLGRTFLGRQPELS